MNKMALLVGVVAMGLVLPVSANPKLQTSTDQTINAVPGKGQPDLLPTPHYGPGPFEGAPNSGYCKNAGGYVLVKLMNNGNADAGAFSVKVTFPYAHPALKVVTKQYAGMPDGAGGIPLIVQIPASAFAGNEAPFKIEVDHLGQVAESNEKNNRTSSKCLKPAG